MQRAPRQGREGTDRLNSHLLLNLVNPIILSNPVTMCGLGEISESVTECRLKLVNFVGCYEHQFQWRNQDFPKVGAPTLGGGERQHTILPNVPKNCMKLKEFEPSGGGASLAPP